MIDTKQKQGKIKFSENFNKLNDLKTRAPPAQA